MAKNKTAVLRFSALYIVIKIAMIRLQHPKFAHLYDNFKARLPDSVSVLNYVKFDIDGDFKDLGITFQYFIPDESDEENSECLVGVCHDKDSGNCYVDFHCTMKNIGFLKVSQ